jgi:DNA-directed RNA polymerase specialized sigma24 family protein
VIGGSTKVDASTKISRQVLHDRQLVDQCLSQAPGAWSQLYEKFHSLLLASIRAFLGKAGQDFHLIDEVSARVWYSLVRNDFELLGKFDIARGCRLSTFFSVVAKTEARLLLRSERRRRIREQIASKSELTAGEQPEAAVLSDAEFIQTLSPAERSFYFDVLVAFQKLPSPPQYSPQNHWQLRHRIRKKLERFLE